MTQRLDLTPLRVQALSFEAHPASARMTDSSLFARFVAQQGTEKVGVAVNHLRGLVRGAICFRPSVSVVDLAGREASAHPCNL